MATSGFAVVDNTGAPIWGFGQLEPTCNTNNAAKLAGVKCTLDYLCEHHHEYICDYIIIYGDSLLLTRYF